MAAPPALGVEVPELEALGSPKMSVNGSEPGAAGVLLVLLVLALPGAPALLLAAGVEAAGVAVLLLLPLAPAAAVPLLAAGAAGAAAAVLAGVGLATAGLLVIAAAAGLGVAATLGLVVGAGTMGLGLPAVIAGTAGFPAAPELAVGAALLQAAANARQSRESACCW